MSEWHKRPRNGVILLKQALHNTTRRLPTEDSFHRGNMLRVGGSNPTAMSMVETLDRAETHRAAKGGIIIQRVLVHTTEV